MNYGVTPFLCINQFSLHNVLLFFEKESIETTQRLYIEKSANLRRRIEINVYGTAKGLIHFLLLDMLFQNSKRFGFTLSATTENN